MNQHSRARRRPRADGEHIRGAILRTAASLATVDGLEGLSEQVPRRGSSRPVTVMAEDSAGLSASPAEARGNPNPAQHIGLEVSEILLACRHP